MSASRQQKRQTQRDIAKHGLEQFPIVVKQLQATQLMIVGLVNLLKENGVITLDELVAAQNKVTQEIAQAKKPPKPPKTLRPVAPAFPITDSPANENDLIEAAEAERIAQECIDHEDYTDQERQEMASEPIPEESEAA